MPQPLPTPRNSTTSMAAFLFVVLFILSGDSVGRNLMAQDRAATELERQNISVAIDLIRKVDPALGQTLHDLHADGKITVLYDKDVGYSTAKDGKIMLGQFRLGTDSIIQQKFHEQNRNEFNIQS